MVESFKNYDLPEDENISLASQINFHDITHDDMKNGTGLRVVLWVAGCTHHCPECQNPITWDSNGGIPFTQWEESEFWTWLDKPWTEGATFSGGDPLHPKNRYYIGEMMKRIKKNYPDKNIWVYTGYKLVQNDASTTDFYLEDDITNERFVFPYLKYTDVLVDGRYECNTRRVDIQESRKVHWRGSSNQRVIDVQKTLSEGKIIEIKED